MNAVVRKHLPAIAAATAIIAAAWIACSLVVILVRHALALRLRASIDAKFASLRVPGHIPASRGIVICAGGPMYLAQAYATLKAVRACGCALSVELFYAGPKEVTSEDVRVFADEFGSSVRFVDAAAVDVGVAPTNLRGFEIKAYALLLTSFEHCLFLDADCVPLADPTPVFEEPAYAMHGNIFWPDFAFSSALVRPWLVPAVVAHAAPPGYETESGQMVVHKPRCLRALAYAWLLNVHADVFYKQYYGDKDLFRLGFYMAGAPQQFYQVSHPPGILGYAYGPRKTVLLCAMVQKWPRSAEPLFAHRTMHKRLAKQGLHSRWEVFVANHGLDHPTRHRPHAVRWFGHHRGTCIAAACPQSAQAPRAWTALGQTLERDEAAYASLLQQ